MDMAMGEALPKSSGHNGSKSDGQIGPNWISIANPELAKPFF